MPLPPEFQFSQSSLQDFVECPRRFELRYVRRLNWPAAESEPIREQEDHMERGAAFHRLVHQHLVGIPVDVLTASISDETVRLWWDNYLNSGLNDVPPARHPEIALSVPLAGRRLIARFDLIAVEPGARAVIVDWKTSLHRPERDRLERRLQTIVYPYVLAGAGAHLNGGQPILPEQIEMIYWFAAHPDRPARFTYSTAQHRTAGDDLDQLARDIETRAEFERTGDEWRCQYCAYRSLCQRGVGAGSFAEMAALEAEADPVEDFAQTFSLDQIGEIAF